MVCYSSTLTERKQQEFLVFKFPGSEITTSKCHWVVFPVCYSVIFPRRGFILMTAHLIPDSHLSTELANIYYHSIWISLMPVPRFESCKSWSLWTTFILMNSVNPSCFHVRGLFWIFQAISQPSCISSYHFHRDLSSCDSASQQFTSSELTESRAYRKPLFIDSRDGFIFSTNIPEIHSSPL